MKRLLLILVLSIPSLPIQTNSQREPERPMASITTPLGADVLEVVSFKAQEGISTLFHVEVNAVAARGQAVPFESLLGKPVQLSLFSAEGAVRHFHGICARVSQGNIERLTTEYRLEVVPQMWLLTRNVQSRTFQKKSVPEIVQSVLGAIGTPLEIRLEGTYLPQKFVVQYNESDFVFISRLMEEEGIFYFFKHEDGKHTLVLGNTPAAHPDIGPVRFQTSETPSLAPDRVSSWEKVQELRSGIALNCRTTIWRLRPRRSRDRVVHPSLGLRGG